MNEDLAGIFLRWGAQVTEGLPLYGRLATATAEDAEISDLLLAAPPEQRLPVLLFAVVHHLLLDGADHRLARWYPTLGGRADSPGDPYADFRDFVLGRREQVVELLATRSTQTNEIGRCSVLRPACEVIAAEVDQSLGLVELGSSAGLNLLLDRWAYAYLPNGPRYGDPAKDVLIEAESRGAALPPIGPVRFGSRVGIDLNPIRVDDKEAVRWLLACVWPEQLTRFQRLQGAIEVARSRPSPPRVVPGDIVETLPLIAVEIPADQHVAVQNSWVLNYLPADERQALRSVLAGIGSERDLSWVSMESPEFAPDLDCPPRPDGRPETGATVAALTTWRGGQRSVRRLADCHPHGTWLRWW